MDRATIKQINKAMQIELKRNGEKVETERITLTIGGDTFRITENKDGGFRINKYNDNDCIIWTRPVTGNEIDIK